MAACPYLLTVRRQGRQAYLQPGKGTILVASLSVARTLGGAFSLDVQRQIEAAVDVQLPVDVVQMDLQRAFLDGQPPGDFLVGEAPGNELHDVGFPCGEPGPPLAAIRVALLPPSSGEPM